MVLANGNPVSLSSAFAFTIDFKVSIRDSTTFIVPDVAVKHGCLHTVCFSHSTFAVVLKTCSISSYPSSRGQHQLESNRSWLLHYNRLQSKHQDSTTFTVHCHMNGRVSIPCAFISHRCHRVKSRVQISSYPSTEAHINGVHRFLLETQFGFVLASSSLLTSPEFTTSPPLRRSIAFPDRVVIEVNCGRATACR